MRKGNAHVMEGLVPIHNPCARDVHVCGHMAEIIELDAIVQVIKIQLTLLGDRLDDDRLRGDQPREVGEGAACEGWSPGNNEGGSNSTPGNWLRESRT